MELTHSKFAEQLTSSGIGYIACDEQRRNILAWRGTGSPVAVPHLCPWSRWAATKEATSETCGKWNHEFVLVQKVLEIHACLSHNVYVHELFEI